MLTVLAFQKGIKLQRSDLLLQKSYLQIEHTSSLFRIDGGPLKNVFEYQSGRVHVRSVADFDYFVDRLLIEIAATVKRSQRRPIKNYQIVVVGRFSVSLKDPSGKNSFKITLYTTLIKSIVSLPGKNVNCQLNNTYHL